MDYQNKIEDKFDWSFKDDKDIDIQFQNPEN